AMTAREVEDRPTSAEVATQLRALLVGDATTTVVPRAAAATTTLAVATPAAPAPAARGRRAAWIAVGLAAALALGGLGVALSGGGGSAKPRQVPPVTTQLPTKVQDDLHQFIAQVKAS